jgi:hypothetical protein
MLSPDEPLMSKHPVPNFDSAVVIAAEPVATHVFPRSSMIGGPERRRMTPLMVLTTASTG